MAFSGHHARKRFGQHWLKDESVLLQIVAAAALQPLAADGVVCDAVAAWLAPESTHPLGELLRRRAAEFDLTYARSSTNLLSPSRSRSEPTATSPSTPAVKRVTTAREAAAAER